VICIDARHIKAVANHTFVPADARANEQSVRAKSVLPLNTLKPRVLCRYRPDARLCEAWPGV